MFFARQGGKDFPFLLRHPVETSSPFTTKSLELSVEFENAFVEIPNASDSTCEQFARLLVETTGAPKVDEDTSVSTDEC